MADTIKSQVNSVLQDPGAQSVARTYATAFLGAANSGNVDEAVEEIDSFVDEVLKTNPDFYAILASDGMNQQEKVGLIDRVVSPRSSEFFANFLKVLANHDRLSIVELIRDEVVRQRQHAMGQQRVQVTSAVELDQATLEKVRGQLNDQLPFNPIIESHVDPDVLGGLIIQVGDTIYDSSLRTRMKQLRASLRTRTLNEIQSGRNRFSNPEGN